jgi:hypothetical protein
MFLFIQAQRWGDVLETNRDLEVTRGWSEYQITNIVEGTNK